MKKLILITAFAALAACETDGGEAPNYESRSSVLQIGPDDPAAVTGTLRGYVIRRSGSPLCSDPVVEGRRITCSISGVSGPIYEVRLSGSLSGFVVQDSQRREVCAEPQIVFDRDRAFIDC